MAAVLIRGQRKRQIRSQRLICNLQALAIAIECATSSRARGVIAVEESLRGRVMCCRFPENELLQESTRDLG